MKKVKEILVGIYHLYTFKPYTTMPRMLEIGYGIVSWFCFLLILKVIIFG